MFKDKLNDVLCSMSITQAQLAELTGYSKSSISQYLSGKNVPSDERQKELAVTLGLEEDYFQQEEVTAIMRSNRIPRLLPSDAARLMGVSERTITTGLRDGVFPWGYAIHGSGDKWIYFINAAKFAEIERIDIA